MPTAPSIEKSVNRKLKYGEWADVLRRRIETGELMPGDRLPPLAEMKALYGLSRPTVERIHSLLEKDGFIVREPNRGAFVARPEVRKRTGLIGFCGWGYSATRRTAYWTHLLEGVQGMAMQKGQGIVLLDPTAANGWDGVDGVLTSNTYESADLPYMPSGLPRVSLLYALPGVTSVAADNYQGGRMATEHLIQAGHRRIACLGVLQTPLMRLRLAGYRDALEAAGLAAEAGWVRHFGPVGFPQPDFRERGKAIMNEWLDDGWVGLNCTALLAQNDLVAIGAMESLQQAGCSVPGDVSIVGFNGTEICDMVSPRLTSLAVPLEEIGALGVETLLQLIEGKSGSVATVLLATRLDERASTCQLHTH